MSADPRAIRRAAAEVRGSQLVAAEERWKQIGAAYLAASTKRILIGEELVARGFRNDLDSIPEFNAATHALEVAERAHTRAFAEYRALADIHAQHARLAPYIQDLVEDQHLGAELADEAHELRQTGLAIGQWVLDLLGRGAR